MGTYYTSVYVYRKLSIRENKTVMPINKYLKFSIQLESEVCFRVKPMVYTSMLSEEEKLETDSV